MSTERIPDDSEAYPAPDLPVQREPSVCELVRQLAVPYVDGEAMPEEARCVEAHIERCAACARDVEIHREIRRELAETLAREIPGSGPRENASVLAARVRARARLERTVHLRRAIVAAAGILLAVGLLLWSVLPPSGGGAGGDPENVASVDSAAAGGSRSTDDGSGAPSEDLLRNLDLLEELEEEGVEPSDELVQLLLETAPGESQDGDVLDPDVFEYLLEEELGSDSF